MCAANADLIDGNAPESFEGWPREMFAKVSLLAYIPRLFVVYSGEFYDDPPAGRLLGLRS
jgi:hypothetical protein